MTTSFLRLRFLIIILCLALFSLSENLLAKQSDDVSTGNECLKCHQKTWDSGLLKSYIHKPFLEKKCVLCHIQDEALVGKSKQFMQDPKVNWLDSRRVTTPTHWFMVPFASINDHVHVEYQVPGQGTISEEIILPPVDELPELVDDNAPPKIENIQIEDISKGLFLTATVSWTTDELSTSQVYYGLKKINQRSDHTYNFTKDHRVQLSELKFKKKYRFKVVSNDIFGNMAESEEFVFSTAKAKPKFSKDNFEENQPDFQKKVKLYKLDDQCVFRIAANQPILVALGTPKESKEKKGHLAAEGVVPEKHNLKDSLMTNTTSCEPCHGKYVKDRNHPVNVSAKPGMAIPEEYFVLSNGNITCMTCHSAHSSDIEYRLVKSSKRELCIGCHLNKI
nr:hypothetical protein [Desulfobulbaceae bacterium]